MPTHEKITDTIIPKTEAPPIPVRTVQTRAKPIVQKPLADANLQPTESNPVQQVNDSSSGVQNPPKTEESVKLSPQLSALARKEQAFRQREQALKEREAAIEQKLLDAEKYEQLKAKMTAKDFAEAEKLGLDYEAYTQYKLEKANGEDPTKAEIQALKEKIEKLEKGSEESAAAQYEETVAEYKKEIAKLVAENADFSTIKGFKKEDAVLKLILDAFENDNEELTISEACQQVEDYLVNLGKNFTELPKFKVEQPAPKKELPRPTIGRTLTNNMNAGGDGQPLKSLQFLPEAERYAEARRRALAKRQG